jgi:4-hydroxy-3-methylbut-2-enyl diphosphate reductase IspH
MGQVVGIKDGKTLSDGETVTDKAQDYDPVAAVWHGAPEMVLEVAKSHKMDYCDAAAYTIHSLLREAEGAAEKHQKAADLLEFIRESFFAGAE